MLSLVFAWVGCLVVVDDEGVDASVVSLGGGVCDEESEEL